MRQDRAAEIRGEATDRRRASSISRTPSPSYREGLINLRGDPREFAGEIFAADGRFIDYGHSTELTCGMLVGRSADVYRHGFSGPILNRANGKAVAAMDSLEKGLGEFGGGAYMAIAPSGDLGATDHAGCLQSLYSG